MQNKTIIKERWADFEHQLVERFGEKMEVKSILFLLGQQVLMNKGVEVGKASKQINMEIMHVGLCTVLSPKGYYQKIGIDEQGWPHYKNIKPIAPNNKMFSHEGLIKEAIMDYLEN